LVDCVISDGSKPPDTIVDLSTLTISIDNRGIARLSITVLTKLTDSISGACSIALGQGRTLEGTIIEDNPKEMVGTEFYEHNLTVLGMVS